MLSLWFFLITLTTLQVLLSVVYCANVLPLERVFPLSHPVELDRLRARDRVRHARLLQGSFVGGVVDFSVQGSSDPYLVGVDRASTPLLYFTKVKLGSPPREFNVQIDTGSDVLWVACSSCSNCPQSSGLGVPLSYYDPASSSTAVSVHCSDQICASAVQTTATQCSEHDQCGYAFQYGDGSGTSGYYVSDTFYFNAILGESLVANSSALVVFGCSTEQSGDLTKSEKAVDGIFGFGQGDLSVISQLSARGVTPRVFSHCLKGDGNGGGILVLGEILEPGIVYSPLVRYQPHYNLDLQSIAVNGQLLPIDPSAYATSNNKGTIIDSGTTLAYLVQEAYDPFISAITAAVSQSASPTMYKGNQCYMVVASVDETFPPVTLNFAGGASMVLKPEEYLMHLGIYDGSALWCMGFQKVQGVTILGDIVLKDKIFVYDLVRQQIGWTNYDCAQSVNVSVSSSKDSINAGQLSVSSSSRDILLKLLPPSIVALLMQIIHLL